MISSIRNQVLDAIKQVMTVNHIQTVKYTSNNFYCSCTDCSEPLHLAEVFKSEIDCKWQLKCSKTRKTQELEEFHHDWLEIPFSSTSYKESEEDIIV